MKRFYLILSLIALLGSASVQAQSVKDVRRHVKRGNRMMHTGQRDKAYEQYRKAFEIDSTNVLVDFDVSQRVEDYEDRRPSRLGDGGSLSPCR